MTHPMKQSSNDSHNSKMRRMTEHYGSASGPGNNLFADSNIHKVEGPEREIGFGADASSASSKRGDRPARRTTAANPVATYAKGGAVKKRDDGGSVSVIESANKDQAATMGRAMGGRTKHKGKGHTNVNVIVAPQGGSGAIPPMVPPGAGMPPPMPPKPPMPPPGAPPPGAGPMGAMGGPPPMMMPPGAGAGMPPRASGGRIEESLKDQGLVRSDKAVKEPLEGETGRAMGGKVTGYDAGALTGEGRLEKIKNYGRRESHAKPQAV